MISYSCLLHTNQVTWWAFSSATRSMRALNAFIPEDSLQAFHADHKIGSKTCCLGFMAFIFVWSFFSKKQWKCASSKLVVLIWLKSFNCCSCDRGHCFLSSLVLLLTWGPSQHSLMKRSFSCLLAQYLRFTQLHSNEICACSWNALIVWLLTF